MKINRLTSVLVEPVGFTPGGTAVYPVFGGAAELDVEPDADEEVEDEPEDPGDEPEDEPKNGKYTPPEKSEWLKVQNSLSKANASAKQRRLELAEAKKQIEALQAEKAEREAAAERAALREQQKGTGKSKRGGGGVAPELPDSVLTRAQVRQATAQAAKEAEERTAERYSSMAKGAAARAALVGEGVDKASANRLVRLLELSEIELDENGEVTAGLDEQLEQLKADLPQLFKAAEPETPKPRRRPAPRATPAPQPEAETRPLSSAERMGAQVLGGR